MLHPLFTIFAREPVVNLLTPGSVHRALDPPDPDNKSHNSQGQNRAPTSSYFKIHEMASLFRTENIVSVNFERFVWSF
jgi:hypothetical protein